LAAKRGFALSKATIAPDDRRYLRAAHAGRRVDRDLSSMSAHRPIAISGYAFDKLNSPMYDFLCMALELSASRCLRKPFTLVALPTVVKRMPVGKPLTCRASQLRQGVMRPG
jgi:hypothetical protein